MFGLIKKILFYGLIAYGLYWLFADGGIEVIKSMF